MTAFPSGSAIAAFLLVLATTCPFAQGEVSTQPGVSGPSDAPSFELSLEPPKSQSNVITIDAAVINPFQTANVGSQVAGVIAKFYFEEGDLVQEGQTVLEIDPERYRLNVQRADEKLKGLEVALKRLHEEASLKTELFELDAVSKQEFIKIKSEAEVTQHRVHEARKELESARLDLQSCRVTAPFTGYLATRFKQPNEPVERLEKIFLLVDSSKVFAVANVPESLLSHFHKGTEAVYVSSSTSKHKGTVERVGKLIDPKSKTKRVYLLIDNTEAGLEIGMTGSVQLLK